MSSSEGLFEDEIGISQLQEDEDDDDVLGIEITHKSKKLRNDSSSEEHTPLPVILSPEKTYFKFSLAKLVADAKAAQETEALVQNIEVFKDKEEEKLGEMIQEAQNIVANSAVESAVRYEPFLVPQSLQTFEMYRPDDRPVTPLVARLARVPLSQQLSLLDTGALELQAEGYTDHFCCWLFSVTPAVAVSESSHTGLHALRVLLVQLGYQPDELLTSFALRGPFPGRGVASPRPGSWLATYPDYILAFSVLGAPVGHWSDHANEMSFQPDLRPPEPSALKPSPRLACLDRVLQFLVLTGPGYGAWPPHHLANLVLLLLRLSCDSAPVLLTCRARLQVAVAQLLDLLPPEQEANALNHITQVLVAAELGHRVIQRLCQQVLVPVSARLFELQTRLVVAFVARFLRLEAHQAAVALSEPFFRQCYRPLEALVKETSFEAATSVVVMLDLILPRPESLGHHLVETANLVFARLKSNGRLQRFAINEPVALQLKTFLQFCCFKYEYFSKRAPRIVQSKLNFKAKSPSDSQAPATPL